MQTGRAFPHGAITRALIGVVLALALSASAAGALETWQEDLVREWSLDHPGQALPEIDWGVSSPLATAANDGAWSLESPPLKYRHAGVYDPLRDRMIVFGGFTVSGPTGGVYSDVWTLSLAGTPTWTQLSPTGSAPGARYGSSIVYDPVRDRVLVFGGQASGGGAFNNVYALSLGASPAWTALAPTGSAPPARSAHAAIYDPVRDRMWIFGGLDGGSNNLGDVWALALADTLKWLSISPAGSIPARRAHTAIYDPVRDRMIIFGGFGDGNPELNDVFALTLAGTPSWIPLSPSGTPPAGRRNHTAIYDPVRDRMVMYGGCTGSACFTDVWAMSFAGAGTWSRLLPAGGAPIFRFGHVAFYDPVRDRMVISGGRDTIGTASLTAMMRCDSWALSLAGTPTWATLPGLPRSGFGFVWDRLRDRVLAYGGNDGLDLGDVWVRPLAANGTWAQLSIPGFTPSGRQHVSAIYDVVRDQVLVFGGQDRFNACYNDLWCLTMSGTPAWTGVATTGTPPDGREGHAAFYDQARDRMLVVGGRRIQGPTETLYNDVWSLALATRVWTKLTPAGTAPAARHGHAMIYDAARDRLVIFGGKNAAGTVLSDVAAVTIGATPTWSALAPTGAPTALFQPAAVADPIRDRMVVFGGWGGTPAAYRSDSRALSLAGTPAWSLLAPTAPAGTPRQRGDFGGIYDPRRDRLVVFGGYGSPPDRAGTLDDTWSLTWGAPVDVPLASSAILELSRSMPNPTRGASRIAWSLPAAGRVRVAVYDIAGRLVRSLVDADFAAGPGGTSWNGRDAAGGPSAAGLYFYRVETLGRVATRKVVLTK